MRISTPPGRDGLRAALLGGGPKSAKAVALVLHGGKEDSNAAVQSWQVAVLRMVPIARRLRLVGSDAGLAVWRLLFTCRGWNGDGARPIDDVRWAVEQLRARHGEVPVVLVGHSLGGRVAVRAAGEDGIVGVVALAPWIPPGEPRDQLDGRRLLVVHGTRDRVTSPAESRRYVEAIRGSGDEACYVGLRGCGHAMMRRAGVWSKLTTDYVLHAGLGIEPGPVIASALVRGEVFD
ncbi:MAG TPA: alpha/beta fold hydrolase [Mycobacterium sp.]|nr:alpha/beta fold hydrolase [Mycobacterium sp.]